MAISKSWSYNYADKCDCSDDDNCGCSYPENMPRNYTSNVTNRVRSAYEYNHMRVGQLALNWSAPAVFADESISDNFKFFDYISDSYALLMFYRADFSAICPKEITAFNQAYEEFKKRGVKVVAVSVDTLSAHQTWRKMSFAEGGVGAVPFPLVSDITKKICSEYGVLNADGMAQRATFLIDKNFVVRYAAVYDSKLERSVSETLRVVDHLIETDSTECKGLECWVRQNIAKNETFERQAEE